MPDIPERLRRRGRPVDDTFEAEEQLYRACRREHVVETRLLPAAISFRDWSLNRGKYSEPEDVLIGREGFGIAKFKVGDVPTSLCSATGNIFDFRVEHAPEEDNYSHSRIIVGRDGTFRHNLDVPSQVKKSFRQILSDKLTIIQQPEV